MDVCGVIVTYNNRVKLLTRVVERCVKLGLKKVIIVNNGYTSALNSLEDLKNRYKDRIEIINFKDNKGSAGGYYAGLLFVKNVKCDYIWLLDDDNLPRKDALKVLLQYWGKIRFSKKNQKIALFANRSDREYYVHHVQNCTTNKILGDFNSFSGFHYKNMIYKLFKLIAKYLHISRGLQKKKDCEVVPVAPYGGMFFHKDLIKKIGLPNKEFFLYNDDIEWTYRITKNDGKIFFVLDSVIEDIDKSWFVKSQSKGKVSNGIKLMTLAPDFRLYYLIRNRVFFEQQNLVTNKIVYYLNYLIYRFLFKLYAGNGKKYQIFVKAVKDGFSRRLGKTFDRNTT